MPQGGLHRQARRRVKAQHALQQVDGERGSRGEGGGQAGRRHVGHGAQVRPRLLAGDALDFLARRRADDLWKGERERGVCVC